MLDAFPHLRIGAILRFSGTFRIPCHIFRVLFSAGTSSAINEDMSYQLNTSTRYTRQFWKEIRKGVHSESANEPSKLLASAVDVDLVRVRGEEFTVR